ncbi:MAG: von Willebrand factor type A domain-containing protein [Verrucomicrobiaceae bacterium]|nr:von Willebrand factor type A domain-containing protein [Verrucomicrobiaceae bacterium]
MKHEQITAWALDELSPQEREQIEAALREDPQIKASAEETKSFCDLLITELRDESLELTSEQRSRLQTMPPASNIIVPSSTSKPVRWSFASRFGSLAAAVACIGIGGYWMYPWLMPQKEQIVAQAVEEERMFRVGLPEVKQQAASGAMADPNNPLAKNSQQLLGALNEPLGVPLPGLAAAPAAATKPDESNITLSGANSYSGDTTVNSGILMVSSGGLASNKTDRRRELSGGSIGIQSAAGKVLAAEMPVTPSASPRPAAAESGSIVVGSSTSPAVVFRSGSIATSASGTGVANSNGSRMVVVEPTSEAPAEKEDPRLQAAIKMLFSPPKTNNESYTRILENELKDVRAEPLSTFSIDVDTASYANVRRFLNQNMLPPADAVRLEELINYFPSDEEGPAADAKEPFAARVELAACPWQPHHRLARIAIQGKQVQKGSKASNLVFLVDVSGSMDDPQKLPLVKQSLRMLAEQMGEGDRVSMVTYASGTQVVLPPTNGENRPQIIAAVDQLNAGGSTNGAGGLRLAYEQAVAGFIKEGINRVILCTDGDFNVGISDPGELEKFIAEKARSGVFLSVLGFGSGNLKDRTMETLADKGNGNYAYIDGLAEARKVLVEQMAGTLVTIAKDVKVQIEFNPAKVRAYRLIGYENRLLAKEDFNDDTKDAGEIGSGHRVVALYEIVPANLPPGVGPDRLVDTLKYQTLASPTSKDLNEVKPATATALDAAASKELMTVKLRYKQPTGETSSKIELPVTDEGKTLEAASGEFQFSAAVAGFGLLLRDSSYKGTLNWEAVRKLALAGKGTDNLGYRGEFLQLIDKAAGLKQTRR